MPDIWDTLTWEQVVLVLGIVWAVVALCAIRAWMEV